MTQQDGMTLVSLALWTLTFYALRKK